MIVKIMVVGNGVHLHHLILEIFVRNLKDQKIDFTGTILLNKAVLQNRLTPEHFYKEHVDPLFSKRYD
ncbi:MAG: hypothetical protein GY860_14470 [Desulfobacteraceae bacterium]|nr:hypothetical protein [Desulfobacteraceae bacterium]